MKKILFLVLLLVVGGGIFWWNGYTGDVTSEKGEKIDPSSVSKVSATLSLYRNDELGFAVKYPTSWEVEETPSKIVFVIPRESGKTDSGAMASSTIGKLEGTMEFIPSKCAFPPVTTVSDRAVVKAGDVSFDTISMSNTVQGRVYFNRMYSTPKGGSCYFFTFASIVLPPASRNVPSAQIPAVDKINKTLVEDADKAFRSIIESFEYVTIEGGKNEAEVSI